MSTPDPTKNPVPGKHFVKAPEGYPILGVWVDPDKTVHYVSPGNEPKQKKLLYEIHTKTRRK